MAYRAGVKPGKAASVAGMVVGGLFLLLGVTVAMPTFGWFGGVWTLVDGVITAFFAYNLFTSRGVSAYEINVDTPDQISDLDGSLRKLAKLKVDGLITE
jgi:hypothetical protein